MLVFTYGMTSNIDNVGVVIVDEDQTAASREYTQRFLSTRHFKQVEVTHAPPVPTQPWPPTRPACSSGSALALSADLQNRPAP